jgi:hypothetical protein
MATGRQGTGSETLSLLFLSSAVQLRNTYRGSRRQSSGNKNERPIAVIWNRLASFLHPYLSLPGSINHEAEAGIDAQNYGVANIPITVTVLPHNVEEPAILDLNGVDVSL